MELIKLHVGQHRASLGGQRDAVAGSHGGVGQFGPAFYYETASPPASHDTTAHSARMAPMIASERVMGNSTQWAASILKAMKASINASP